MKTTFLFWILTIAFTASAQTFDRFNAYVWNYANYEMDGGRTQDRGDWFEWWYYKVVDQETQQAYFFTYGVINPWDTLQSHENNTAVIQVGDFTQKFILSKRFPLDQFQASYESTDIRIGDNRATDKHIQGHVQDENGNEVSWDIAIEKQWGFNAMGWTMGIPEASNIYWYPVQAAATMTGWLTSNGKTIHFKNAPAYQDRNWGRSFPKWWTWLTANGFKNHPGSVLAAGGGEPKVFNTVHVNGSLVIGFKHLGREYFFRSSDFDKVDFDIRWGHWNLAAENKRGERIVIEASAPPEKFIDIQFYSPQGEIFHDYETLNGDMTVKIYHWDVWSWSWKLFDTIETNQAGVEWGTPHAEDPTHLPSFSRHFPPQR